MAYNGAFKKEIEQIVPGRIRWHELMAHHTSMGVGGTADLFIEPGNVDELRKALACLVGYSIPFVPVGNCTNLIVRDGGYRGAIISLRGMGTVDIKLNGQGNGFIYGEAGVALSRLVKLTVRECFTGMEFCAGIPGSIGGAVKMNAGAYGSELKDVIAEVTVIDRNGIIAAKRRGDLSFEYRNLVMEEESIIVSAVFGLQEGDKEQIRKRIAEIISMRKQKHPLGYRNAGSIFKNPKPVPAGKIIDDLGLKGSRVGDAQISEQHGNFIINLGSATCRDIIRLIDYITKRVAAETGISLETEIKIIGDV